MRDPSDNPNINLVKRQYAEGKYSRREFLRYSTALGLSATAAYAFVEQVTGRRQAYAGTMNPDLPRGGTIKISLLVTKVDKPTWAGTWPGHIMIMQTLDLLTKVSPDNVVGPNLLESWEASDDLLTWTLRTRKDVKWHDGRDFGADDVIWNLRHCLDPETGSSLIGLMKGYMMNDEGTELWDASAIERVDAHTLRLNLRAPQIAVPIHLFHYEFLMQDAEAADKFGVGVNGTGAFTLVEHDVKRKAVFKAQPGFWGEGPYVDTLEFIDHGDDPSAQIAALASKQVHGLFEASIVSFEALSAMDHLQLHQAQTALTPVAGMRADRPPFDDPRVRLALRYATDQERMQKVVQRGLGLPAEHHQVYPYHPGYAELPFFGRDVARAKQLLAEAGYSDGLTLDLQVPQTPWYCFLGAQALEAQWAEIGVKTNLVVQPEAQFWEVSWPNADFQMGYWLHRSIETMVLGLGYRSGVPWNTCRWSNLEFDRLLTEAEGILDVDKRRELIREIEIIMQQDGPVVQPIWVPLITFYDKRVKNFRMQPPKYIYGHEMAIET